LGNFNPNSARFVSITQLLNLRITQSSRLTEWTYETDEMKQHGSAYTNSDGTPHQEKIYRSDFYDDMVAGVDRVMSIRAILGAPVVVGE
jgi:hypothetical protein